MKIKKNYAKDFLYMFKKFLRLYFAITGGSSFFGDLKAELQVVSELCVLK